MMMSTVPCNDAAFNVQYQSNFFAQDKADVIFQELKTLNFFTPTFKIRNRNVKPKRLIAAYGDEGLVYNFSGASISALPWTPLLVEIRDQVERTTGCTYNYVLLNLYANGSHFISQHKYDENCLDATVPLAVLSFGETRKIEFKKPQCKTVSFDLEHGSLYIIQQPTNDHFTHGIPQDSSKKGMRISLSFRHIITPTKKQKMVQDEFPADNWFSQLCSNAVMSEDAQVITQQSKCDSTSEHALVMTQPSNPNLPQWDLGNNIFVNIVYNKNFLRVHIREYAADYKKQLFPTTKNVIAMLNSTWSDLTDKLLFYEYKDCFVVNRQLLVASMNENYTLFQQMFDSKVSGYILKPSYLKLSKEQVSKLKDVMLDISESLIQVQLTQFLPDLILSKANQCVSHFESEDEAKVFLLETIRNEVDILATNYYPCTGCVFNDNSPCNHECIMRSFQEKLAMHRVKVLTMLNLYLIVKQLREKCMCYFTEAFLKQFDVTYLENYFQNCK